MQPQPVITDLDTWKAAAKAGNPRADAVLRKQFVADEIKAEGDDEDRKLTFVISTGVEDRDRDSLRPGGWALANYRKNPVVLWAHDYRGLPVGQSEKTLVSAGQLRSTCKFADVDLYPFADTVFRMVKAKFLRAVSVGFNPLEWAWDDDRGGYDFTKQELLEYSIVPVPANPEALIEGKRMGIDMAPLLRWAEGVLDAASEEPGVWVPQSKALEAFKTLSAPRVAGFDPAPFLAELEKRGRALTEATADQVRAAGDATAALFVALDELAPVPVPAPEKAAPLALLLTEPMPLASASLLVNPEDVKAAVVAAVSEAAKGAVNRATGRFD
jgi:HK97 family phage prohead protease